jgi:hypothetical protein
VSNRPWQKSTYSPDASNCVYVAAPTSLAALLDTAKNHPARSGGHASPADSEGQALWITAQ